MESLLTQMFGHPQGGLGRMGGWLMARLSRGVVERAVGLLDLRAADRLIEVGFGPGVAIECAARQAAFVAGVDYSPTMVEVASQRNIQAIRAGQVALRQGSALALPFADGAFDKALSMNSLHIWPDWEGGLREIRRVLKPGGLVVISLTRPAVSALQEPDQLARLLADADFREVSLHTYADGVSGVGRK